MTVTRIERVDGFDGRLLPGSSPIEQTERSAIAAGWAKATAANPQLFNGKVLLADEVAVVGRRLRLGYIEANFATYLWLRDRGGVEQRLLNAFGGAAVVSSDGKVLLARMAKGSANEGLIYFPAGTPDRDDLVGDVVDLDGSIDRELAEETGIVAPLARPAERRVAVWDGRYVACVRRIDVDLTAAEIEERVGAHLAAERAPELDALYFVRSADEAPDGALDYVRAALPHLLGA